MTGRSIALMLTAVTSVCYLGATARLDARPAAARSSCTLPRSSSANAITFAKDIADSGKRPTPRDAKALFKRSIDVLLAWAPDANRVFSGDTANGTVSLTNAASDPRVTRVPLSGRPAGSVLDATSGCLFVSVPERGEVVAIDPGSATITRTFALAGGNHPATILLDAADRLLFVANGSNATIEVVNLKSMEVMDVASTDAPVRALALDSAWHRVYVVAEDGRVSGYDLRRSRLLRTGVVDQISAAGIAVDPQTHAVYVILAGSEQRPSLRILQGVAPAAPRCVFHHSTPGSPCLAKYAVTR
jgi:DNA-binding beta-propeller fold protein YncE